MRLILYIVVSITVLGCTTTKQVLTNKEKDWVLFKIIEQHQYPRVNKHVLSLRWITPLPIAVNIPGRKNYDALTILKEPLSHSDSLYLNKSIAAQRKLLTLKLPSGKEYVDMKVRIDTVKKMGYLHSQTIELSDPIYFPKEKIYVVYVHEFCGSLCGSTHLRAYKKEKNQLILVSELQLSVS